MFYHVSDLSSEQRLAIESLLGRSLQDEESLTIRPVIKKAPTAQERERLVQQLDAHMDMMAECAKDASEEDLEAALEEALNAGRRG